MITSVLIQNFPTAPAFLSEGPVRGAGKTLLMQTITALGAGRSIGVTPMLMRWCKALGAWPGDMDETLELKALGLSENDLEFEAIEASKASENRKREARSVSFNGRSIDPEDNIDFGALAEEIGGSLSRSVLSHALSSHAPLAIVEEAAKEAGSSKKNKKGKGSGQLPRIPPEKTEFIGRLGEIVVYSWLKTILK